MMKKLLLALGFSLVLGAANAQTINSLGSGSALSGTEKIPMFQSANPAVTTTPNAIKTFVGASGVIPYIAGHYYVPYRSPYANTLNSDALSTDTIRCYTAYFKGLATLDTLTGQLGSTAFTGGNFQLAIYAINPATGLPTGNALVSTGNLSTATASVKVTGSVNGGTPVQLGSALNALTPYAFCANVDNSTATIVSVANQDLTMAADIGTATLNNLTQNGGSLVLQSYSVAQTFGTWPNLTSASFTENLFGSVMPILHFSSVP